MQPVRIQPAVLRCCPDSPARAAAWCAVAGLVLLVNLAATSRGDDALPAPSFADAISSAGETVWSPQGAPLADEYEPPAAEPIPEVGSGDGERAPCVGCNGGGAGAVGPGLYNRCSCSCGTGTFPWFTGPGRCDNWCVGPHWDVSLDGLILFRDDADWGRVINDVGTAPDLVSQFDSGPGVRLFATGYNYGNFGLQIGYEGVNEFNATALFPEVGALRAFDYVSKFNSLEINFVRKSEAPWKPFGGFRYIELGENFVDSTTFDKPLPPPLSTPGPNAAYVDTATAVKLKNRLIGFQAGAYRDVWRLGRRWTLEPYGNAGVYFNDFRRRDVSKTINTVVAGDDLDTVANEFSFTQTSVSTIVTREFDEVAFLGEIGVSSIWRINQCVALRGGYQAIAFSGVGQALDGFFAPGFQSSDLVMHGFHFGVEYER